MERDRWHRISECLPPPNECVLLKDEYGRITTGTYCPDDKAGLFWDYGSCATSRPSESFWAFMPRESR